LADAGHAAAAVLRWRTDAAALTLSEDNLGGPATPKMISMNLPVKDLAAATRFCETIERRVVAG
jgi:hypothetical protein